jgi:hypothetical protein
MRHRLRLTASQGIRLKGDNGDGGDVGDASRTAKVACVIDVTPQKKKKRKKKEKKTGTESNACHAHAYRHISTIPDISLQEA